MMLHEGIVRRGMAYDLVESKRLAARELVVP